MRYFGVLFAALLLCFPFYAQDTKAAGEIKLDDYGIGILDTGEDPPRVIKKTTPEWKQKEIIDSIRQNTKPMLWVKFPKGFTRRGSDVEHSPLFYWFKEYRAEKWFQMQGSFSENGWATYPLDATFGKHHVELFIDDPKDSSVRPIKEFDYTVKRGRSKFLAYSIAFGVWSFVIGIWYLALKDTRNRNGDGRNAKDCAGALWFPACIGIFLVLVTGSISSIMHELEGGMRWGVLLAGLPTLIVMAHAIFIGWFRRKEFEDLSKSRTSSEHLNQTWQLIDRERERYFSPGCIGLRYGLPAILLAVVPLVGFLLLFQGELEVLLKALYGNDDARNLGSIHEILVAARLGMAGSYVYVISHLGERGFRHDVTSGGAMWCVITLILGPLLAVIVHLVWTGGSPVNLSTQALYFTAGLMPRHVASLVTEAVSRLQQSSGALVDKPRILPLSNITGITRGIEERLGEEGVEDVYTLAMFNPLRLIRNTPYNTRQIVDWMDQALMIKHVPKKEWRDKLEELGYMGVIHMTVCHGKPEMIRRLEQQMEEAVQVPEGALSVIVGNIYHDKQVKMIWALYRNDEMDAPSVLPEKTFVG